MKKLILIENRNVGDSNLMDFDSFCGTDNLFVTIYKCELNNEYKFLNACK